MRLFHRKPRLIEYALSAPSVKRIKAGEKYLMIFDRRAITMEDALKLQTMIKKEYAAEMPVTLMIHGDPKTAVQFVQANTIKKGKENGSS